MVTKWLTLWANKYKILFNQALLLDEFFYLVSDKRLIKNSVNRAILHKYKVIIDKCENGDQEKCNMICKEFNMNKFTYLIDGEDELITDFLNQFDTLYDLISNPKRLPELFLIRRNEFTTVDMDKMQQETVLSDIIKQVRRDDHIDPEHKLKFDFGEPPMINFLEKIHPTNTV